MQNQTLTLLICAPLLIGVIAIVAILGMRPRITFANRIFRAYKTNKIEYESSQNTKKRGKLIFLQLFLVVSFFVLSVLVITGVLNFSNLVLGAYLILILLSIVIGHILYKDVEKILSKIGRAHV